MNLTQIAIAAAAFVVMCTGAYGMGTAHGREVRAVNHQPSTGLYFASLLTAVAGLSGLLGAVAQ